ncbi:hypothetical protein [Solihabitans fulvus]|uniref:hypothetical protein n=1 Tax=Solihabitans fulvus TaxID=1892852 RepID=UPI001661C148|nr:hypothetical protein [Solihabitans fulvus]
MEGLAAEAIAARARDAAARAGAMRVKGVMPFLGKNATFTFDLHVAGDRGAGSITFAEGGKPGIRYEFVAVDGKTYVRPLDEQTWNALADSPLAGQRFNGKWLLEGLDSGDVPVAQLSRASSVLDWTLADFPATPGKLVKVPAKDVDGVKVIGLTPARIDHAEGTL